MKGLNVYLADFMLYVRLHAQSFLGVVLLVLGCVYV